MNEQVPSKDKRPLIEWARDRFERCVTLASNRFNFLRLVLRQMQSPTDERQNAIRNSFWVLQRRDHATVDHQHRARHTHDDARDK